MAMKKLNPMVRKTKAPAAKINKAARTLSFNVSCKELFEKLGSANRCDIYYDEEEKFIYVKPDPDGGFAMYYNKSKVEIRITSLLNTTDAFDYDLHPVRINGVMLEINFKEKPTVKNKG